MSKRLNRILNSQDEILKNGVETRGARAGHSFAAVDAVYKSANGLCAICSKPRGKRNHALDHDHATGKLRGILCQRCNVGLGYFDDSVDLLRQAIDYLNKYK